jgi:glycosyltransferase involved in cell wall biosynthesis
MKVPISVCMIVRDEEANIVACLSSVSSFVEEIIVVDTGSQDGTRERALALGAQVYPHLWQDDFSRARNEALEKATQPWILVLDADEEFDPASLEALQAYCEQSGQAAGRVQIVNVLEDGSVESRTEIVRLFPNRPDYRYEGRIHEQVKVRGETPPSISTGVALLHKGYAPDAIERKGKVARNLHLLRLEQKEHPDSAYLAYQVGKTLYVGKQYRDAAVEFERAIDRLQQAAGELPGWFSTLLVQYGYCLLHVKEYPRLFEVMEAGVDLYPDFTDLYFIYGLALIQSGQVTDLNDIREVFEHCLRLGEPDASRYETVAGVGTYRAHFNLGVYYQVIGDKERARQHYQMALAAGYEPARNRLMQGL